MTQTAVTESAGLPAVREPTRLDDLARLGSWLALSESGSDSEKAKGAAAALRLYYAAELGLPPLAAAELSVIKGRLFVSAQLLRALAARAGYQLERDESTDTSCTATLSKDGTVVGSATYTLEEAKKAGLIRSGSAWTTHPARMLWARASKNVIVDFAPAVALGLALDDEALEYLGEVVAEQDDVPWPEGEPEAEYVPRPEPEASEAQTEIRQG